MNDLTKLADHAAEQSDRWMFAAIFILFVLALGVAWRWMINDREKVSTRLTQVTDRHISAMERFSEVVATNTAALANNTDVLHKVDKKL
jgi:hypothetical protein